MILCPVGGITKPKIRKNTFTKILYFIIWLYGANLLYNLKIMYRKL